MGRAQRKPSSPATRLMGIASLNPSCELSRPAGAPARAIPKRQQKAALGNLGTNRFGPRFIGRLGNLPLPNLPAFAAASPGGPQAGPFFARQRRSSRGHGSVQCFFHEACSAVADHPCAGRDVAGPSGPIQRSPASEHHRHLVQHLAGRTARQIDHQANPLHRFEGIGCAAAGIQRAFCPTETFDRVHVFHVP